MSHKSDLHREARERGLEVTDVIGERMLGLLIGKGYPAEQAVEIVRDAIMAQVLVCANQQVHYRQSLILHVRNQWIYSRSHKIEEVVEQTGLHRKSIEKIIRQYRRSRRLRDVD
jgi:hypothetical protein